MLDREKTARFSMLETLADHDDELMEQLLGDIEPPKDKVFDDLVEGVARRPGLSGADGLGDAHQRRAAPDEGAAPRGARRRHHRQAARRQGRQRSARLCDQDAAHRARRQDVDRARAQRSGRRRHDLPDARARGRPRRRRVQAHGPDHREARPGRRRRNRRARQARPCHDRRHHHRRQAGACGAADDRADAAGARHRGLGQGAQGRRQARPGAAQAAGRRPVGHDGAQSRGARGGRLGPGRDAPARRGRAAGRSLRRRHHHRQAERRLPRDHQEADPAARAPQEAVRRSRPVRRHRRRHQADAARLRLHLRGGDQGRRGAAQLHPVGGGGRPERAQARPARLPGGRRRR